MYNYHNDFTKFLIEQNVVKKGEGKQLAYIGPPEYRAMVEGMNEYYGECVDLQELYRDTLPSMYADWHTCREKEDDEGEDKIMKVFVGILLTQYKDLILFVMNKG